MKIKKEINESYFVEELPGNNGNAYSSSRYLYHMIKVDGNKIIASSEDDLSEAVDLQIDDSKKGGIIVLSTDVNAIKMSENKLVNWVKQRVETLKNRMFKTSMIDKVSQKYDLVGWTVGYFLDGRYTAKNGVPFGEQSLSVEIIGVTSETLINIATDLCRVFTQEAVLVKDYTTGSILLVNRD